MIQHSSAIGLGELLVLLAVGGVFLAVWAGSVAWVWRDANRRGQPGFIVAVLVALLCWPVSLIVWLFVRPQPGSTPASGGPRSRGWGWALLMVVVIGVMVAAIALGIALPAFAKARESADRAQCLNQVRQIAVKYVWYREQHGRSPVALSDLDMNPACPSARRRSIPLPPKSNLSLVCYELLPGTEPTDIIVREYWENHRGKGGAIAFGDGHVEWCASPYKPLRTDVVRARVEKELRRMLGDQFIKVVGVTFDAPANRYDVKVHLKIDGQESVRVLELRQNGVGIANYAGSLSQGGYHYSLYVDELMERQEPAKNTP